MITEPLYSVFSAQAPLSLDSASTSEGDDVQTSVIHSQVGSEAPHQ
jgi:hypothetical protein